MTGLETSIKRALISVSDKTGIEEFALELAKLNIQILSTGGTSRLLKNAGLNVVDVSDFTGFPEILDGRVKTLHPKIHGGLLAIRDNSEHDLACKENDILPIDLLVVNLYPFEAARERDAAYAETIENIDVGGPAMIRAAAKNHEHVTVLTDPMDYKVVLDELKNGASSTSLKTRKRLAAKAFARTAGYDSFISAWLLGEVEETFPPYRALGGSIISSLRYGENPHQKAAFYSNGEKRFGVASAKQIQGKELSYNNINDTDAAFECVAEFDSNVPACVIVKHANPCGAALGKNLKDAYLKALACDSVSAFGGILAFNQTLDAETAEDILKLFTEVIIAPGASPAALKILEKKKNLRLLLTNGLPDPTGKGLTVKSVSGGLLVQERDNGVIDKGSLRQVSRRTPTETEMDDLIFAFKLAKHVKSNAIVYAKNLASVGIGAGQMSRLDSSRIAARKSVDAAQLAGDNDSWAIGSVVASDAFFPFADGLLAAAEAGATAIIQPGGSMRDDEIIAAADEAGLAMLFTGIRHFKH